jgi:hypothetical protein
VDVITRWYMDARIKLRATAAAHISPLGAECPDDVRHTQN